MEEPWVRVATQWPIFLSTGDQAPELEATGHPIDHNSWPMINRWDDDTSPTRHETGWGMAWKRYRLRLPATVPHDYKETFLRITRTWDKGTWELNENQEPVHPGTITEVAAVTLTLPAGQTQGPWEYATPISPNNDLISEEYAPVEILTPKHDGHSSGYLVNLKNTHRLKVAKWEDAFEIDGEDATLLPNFNDRDRDRFYLRVPMPWLEGEGSTTVRIRVGSEEGITDPENAIEMLELPNDPGVFQTRALLLVSNDVDDGHPQSGGGDANFGGTDEALDDVTHKAKLGDTVTFTITCPDNSECEVTADVPVLGTVDLAVWRHDVPGVRSWPEIDEAVAMIQRTYAQVGVQFQITKQTTSFSLQDFSLYISDPNDSGK